MLSSKDSAILGCLKNDNVNSVCAGIGCEKVMKKFSNVYLLINYVVFFTKAFIDYAKCGAL